MEIHGVEMECVWVQLLVSLLWQLLFKVSNFWNLQFEVKLVKRVIKTEVIVIDLQWVS